MRKGTKVELDHNGIKIGGTTDNEPSVFPGGPIVGVTLDDEFSHLTPTGQINAYVDELTERN